MKAIKQLQFKLTRKDYENHGEFMPYAWVSFNPEDLEAYSSIVLVFYTLEDFAANKGVASFISEDMSEEIYMYECTPLK